MALGPTENRIFVHRWIKYTEELGYYAKKQDKSN